MQKNVDKIISIYYNFQNIHALTCVFYWIEIFSRSYYLSSDRKESEKWEWISFRSFKLTRGKRHVEHKYSNWSQVRLKAESRKNSEEPF